MNDALSQASSPTTPAERRARHRVPAFVLAGIICLGLCLTAATALLIGVEYDEAWIIAAHLGLFQPDALPDQPPVLTTGGPHMAIIGGLGDPGPMAVALARGLSLASLLLMLVLLERVLRRWFADQAARLIVVAMVIATPGTLLLGGMGYGVVPAMLFLLCGFFFWTGFNGNAWLRIAGTGLLCGLALATRWTFLPLVAPMLLAGALLATDIRSRWLQGIAATAVAMAVFAGFLLWHSGMGSLPQTGGGPDTLGTNAAASGLSAGLPQPARLTGNASRFVTLTSIPILLSALACAVLLRDQIPGSLRKAIVALVAASLFIALAWALRSPFLHTRYIWPSVLMLNIAAGLILAQAFTMARNNSAPLFRALRLLCVAIPIGMVFETSVISFRLVAAGSGYETNHAGYGSQEAHFKAFRLKREQREITRVLSETLSPETRIATLGLPAEWGDMQLALLAQRRVAPLSLTDAPAIIPDIIITHDFARLSSSGQDWLRRVSADARSVYGYRLYRVDPARFTPPAQDVLVDNALYRFSLRRAQTLSGR